MSDRKLFGKILIEMKMATVDQIQAGLKKQKETGRMLGDELVDMGAITPIQKIEALGRQYEMEVVDLKSMTIDPAIFKLITREVAVDNSIMPLELRNGSILVATANPVGLDLVDNLRFKLGREVETCLAPLEDINAAIEKHYGISEDTLDQLIEQQGGSELEIPTTEEAEGADENDSRVIKLVHKLIADAVACRASDIHIEPMEKRVRIRYRIDGNCQEVDMKVSKRLQGPIISRVKIMSRLDIAEKRKPQDGQINFPMGKKHIDLRVSSLPAQHGESVVLRILDKDSLKGNVEELGFSSGNLSVFLQCISKPNGVFLVTGPTGSGKTTTLYGALKHLNRPDVKIITAEDPVEYHLSGINQCQVNHQIEFGFNRILRAMLRQAPNIILVGEIRDKETGDIAIEAALTGHFVFSTVHTNDAPSTVTRLIDIGVEPFQVASAVSAVLAQRLVRTICTNCKETYVPEDITFRLCDLDPDVNRSIPWYRGAGCDKCGGKGYKGRMSVHELMVMTRPIMDMTFKRQPSSRIRREALMGGMVSLRMDAIEKAKLGFTTLDEVLVVSKSDVDLMAGAGL
ncbi:MAG: GspE/PulE family protein [Planctomycetota bacterium]